MKHKLIISGLLILINFQLYCQTETNEPKGKVTGEFFGDYYYKLNGDTGSLLKGPGQYQQTEVKGQSFEIRRFNLGYEYTFNDIFSARLMLEGNDGFTIAPKDSRGVYIKYAYLQWKNIFKGSNLIFGAQSTPTFATFSEKIWSYRSVEKSIIDFHKQASSNDVGISLSGNLYGNISYYLMAGNGRSTSVENNNYKRFYGSVHGSILERKLLFEIYADYERQSGSTYNYILKGFLGYQQERYTIGFEPYTFITANDSLSKNKSVLGISLFARGNIIKQKLNAFYRIDFYDDDSNSDTNYKETFMVFGIDYTPASGIDIIPNVWINGYYPEGSLVNRKADIVARITFRYKI